MQFVGSGKAIVSMLAPLATSPLNDGPEGITRANAVTGVKPDAQLGVALPPGHSGVPPRLLCTEWALTNLTGLPAPTRKTSFSSIKGQPTALAGCPAHIAADRTSWQGSVALR